MTNPQMATDNPDWDYFTDTYDLAKYVLSAEKKSYQESSRTHRKNHVYTLAHRVQKSCADQAFRVAELEGALRDLVVAIQKEIPEKKTTRTLSNAVFRADDILRYMRK